MVTIETTLITLNLSAWQDLGGEPWFCRPCGPSLGRNRPKGVQPPRRMRFGTSRVCRQKDQVSQQGIGPAFFLAAIQITAKSRREGEVACLRTRAASPSLGALSRSSARQNLSCQRR